MELVNVCVVLELYVYAPESMDCLSVLFKQVTKLFVERRMGEGAITDQDNDIGKTWLSLTLAILILLILIMMADPTIPLLPAPPGYEQVDPHVFAKGKLFTTVSSVGHFRLFWVYFKVIRRVVMVMQLRW